jgi:hypothetical protein
MFKFVKCSEILTKLIAKSYCHKPNNVTTICKKLAQNLFI